MSIEEIIGTVSVIIIAVGVAFGIKGCNDNWHYETEQQTIISQSYADAVRHIADKAFNH